MSDVIGLGMEEDAGSFDPLDGFILLCFIKFQVFFL